MYMYKLCIKLILLYIYSVLSLKRADYIKISLKYCITMLGHVAKCAFST